MKGEKGLVYDQIKKRCSTLGISISELCRKSNVDRQVLHNWKGKNPKTIDILLSLNESLNVLETKN